MQKICQIAKRLDSPDLGSPRGVRRDPVGEKGSVIRKRRILVTSAARGAAKKSEQFGLAELGSSGFTWSAMEWVDYVIVINALATIVVVGLFLSSLRGIRDRVPHHAFLGILIGQVGWSISDTLSAVLAVRFGYFADILGTSAGLAVIGIALCTYIFCEYFGADRAGARGRRARAGVALVGGLVVSALTFSERFITGRRVTEGGVRVGEYGPYFVVVGLFVAGLVLAGIALLVVRSLRTNDPRLRAQLRMFALGLGATLLFAFWVTYVLPLLGDFRFDFAGPPSFVIFVSVVLYTILFHEFVDLKRAYALAGIHLIVGGLSLGALGLLFVVASADASGVFSAGRIFAPVPAFLAGIAYRAYVIPRLRALVRPPQPDLVETLVALFSAAETGAAGAGRLAYLRDWLETLTRRLGILDATLVLGRAGVVERITARGGRLPEGLPRRVTGSLGRRVPGPLRATLDTALPCEGAHRMPANFTRRYPRVTRAIEALRAAAFLAGYPILLPLLRDEKLEALLLLGIKNSGRLYYEDDLQLLHALRFPLAAALRRVDEGARLVEEKAHAEDVASRLSRFLFETEKIEIDPEHRLLYRSGSMAELIAKTRLFAAQDSPVLILGETGTGKELFARILHNEHSQTERPFVAINCAAIPETLWEDELFGHVRGAFTDARENREGKLAEAGNGSIFLDEVGELPLPMQARLLRVLQERAYNPLGSDKVKTVRCRFIFATNRDLLGMVNERTFREDLYYRINVFEIKLPPLRERLSDVPILARHVLDELAEKNARVARELSPTALRGLVEYTWPGNVRELQNVLVRAATLAGDRPIEPADLDLRPGGQNPQRQPPGGSTDGAGDFPGENYKEAVEAFRRSLIVRALHAAAGNKTRAAELLGIKRTTLNSQMKELKLSF